MSKHDRFSEEKHQEQTSSPGINSPSVTPKDVSPEDVTSKDVITRKTASPDLDEREEEQLDDAVELTFPASDPIAIPTPEEHAHRNRPGRP